MPHHVAMSAETTLPAGIDSAAWFVPTAALWAGLAGVVFILQHELHPFSLGFVLNKGTDFPVAPPADSLVVWRAMVDAISAMTDIAHHDGPRLAPHRDINDSTTDFVLHVAQHTGVLGFHARPGTHQPFAPPGACRGATDGRLELCQALGMALVLMTPFTAGDESRFLRITHHGGMDFSQINTDGVGTRRGLGHSAIFDHDMPRITPGFLVTLGCP